MEFVSASTIINRVAIHCGLAAVGDPYASTEANMVLLRELLNTVGDDLISKYEWDHLIKEGSFVTTAAQTTQALPADFHQMVDRTMWNRSSRLRAAGPMTGTQTQMLKAWTPALVTSVLFRIQFPNFTFPVSPPVGATIAYEYESSYWVALAGSTTGTKASVTLTDDVVLLDQMLMIRGVKLQWLLARGKDTTVAAQEFEDTLTRTIGQSAGASALSLVGGRKPTRYLDNANLPDTGFGTPP